ncbi:MAG TPA: DUF2845 domain-containing protein [Geobacterales bacterium]|nr:DUF2845 domain-containing protein [Geobacterales bacterium]
MFRKALFVLLSLWATATFADSMRCGDQIVSTGVTAAEVILRCGPPFHREEREEKVVVEEGSSRYRRVQHREEWLYNLGADHFVQLRTFEDGTLTGIRSGGYGVTQTPALALCQEGRGIVVGMTAGELALLCGTPLQRQERSEEEVSLEDGKKRRTTIEWGEWQYNFGANRFMVTVTLRNGRVTEVKSGSYGFGEQHP